MKFTPLSPKNLGLLLLALCLSGFVRAADLEPLSGGPLAHQFKLTLTPGDREEEVGPLFYLEHTPAHDLTAMPPLWSCTRYKEIDAIETDVLYPLFTYDRFGEEYRVQLFQWLSLSGGRTQNETNKHRATIFPFYFQQRSPIPAENYTALFPFYGTLKNRFFRDETHFVMWPGYVQTRKRDVVTDNYLVPFFHLRHGDGLQGWQFWPLFGQEHKDITHPTNHWGDAQLSGGHDKTFVLWPLYMNDVTGIGTTNLAHQLAMLPFFSILRSPLRDSTSAPWLLGITYTVDREKKYRELDAPWPLIVFARGEGKTTTRVWPLFSAAHTPTQESDFILWPLYKFNRLDSAPLLRERTRLGYFLYSNVTEANAETHQNRQRVEAWPFFAYRRDWDGSTRWQALALIESVLPASKSVDRNWSPLWSLWRAEHNALTGAESQSLLWNFYRHDVAVTTNAVASLSETNKKSSLLLGLVQWRVTPEGRKARWFYLPGETSY